MCVFAAGAVFAKSYNVKVETYVGGRLEDKFQFVIKSGHYQEKGYDGKYLAKRFLAKGFINASVEREDERAAAKELAEKERAKTLAQKLDERINALRIASLGAEKRAEAATVQMRQDAEKIQLLEEILKLEKSGSAKAKAKYEEYKEQYGESKQDIIDAKKLARLRKIKYQDFEEYDLGSYCRMEILQEIDSRTVRFNISYGYSRLMSMEYHDGLNTNNSITKYPVFEIFERLNAKAKIVLGKPYCIQFGRPSSREEAKTIQDSIAQTRLFSGKDIEASSSAQTPRQGGNSDEPAETVSQNPLDQKGSLEKISSKYEMETARTVRAVFTVTLAK